MRVRNTGFSLVELSIVLVILGLLVGAILTAQSLISASELRSVTTEFDKFQTAVNIFREKYRGLPGDLENAGQFWGYADTSAPDGGCGDPENNAGVGTETCDGTGNGQIGNMLTHQWEPIRFWQHLVNAGLIEGAYNGVGSAPEGGVINVNIPASKFANSGWIVNEIQNFSGDDDVFAYDYGNGFHLGAPLLGFGAPLPIFTPEELWNIDTKMDDGKPGKGKVIARWIQACTNADDEFDLDTDYNLQNQDIACSAYFAKAF